MAYNNMFPIGYQSYQPTYQQPQYMQTAQQPQQNGFIWVQGEAGAKSYLVAPNTTVQLWDSENQVIYLKSADSSGMPSIKTLDYTIRESSQTPIQAINNNNIDFITKDEFNALKRELERLKAIVNESHSTEVEDNG